MKGDLLVTMSGGTTPVINATLGGIVREVVRSGCFDDVLAGVPGIQGVLDDRVVRLGGLSLSQLARLRQTPGSAVVGTTRVAFLEAADVERLYEVIRRRHVTAFVNIGGNGTLLQTRAIARAVGPELQVAAAPKTVDNDLGDADCRRVFFTPGFPSCVNLWIQLLGMLNVENLGACSHDQVLVAQTFGRETGFIAGAVRAADPHRRLPLLILLPEDAQPLVEVLAAIDDMVCRRGRAIVVTSEGYPMGDVGGVIDKSGQTMFGSSRTTAAQLLVDRLIQHGIQARSFIPTVLQRQSSQHALAFDRDIAERQGRDIVQRLAGGDTEFLSTVVDPRSLSDPTGDPIAGLPFETITEFSRRMHPRFLAAGGFDVSDEYLEYLGRLFTVSRCEQAFECVHDDYLMPTELSDFEGWGSPDVP